MNSEVLIYRDGRIMASTKMQDGSKDISRCASVRDALKYCKESERLLNGMKIKKREIPVRVQPPKCLEHECGWISLVREHTDGSR